VHCLADEGKNDRRKTMKNSFTPAQTREVSTKWMLREVGEGGILQKGEEGILK